MSNGDFWSAAIWQQFNGDPNNRKQTPGLLASTMGPMQVAQHVFNVVVTGTDNSIPADTVDLHTGMPTTGVTRSLATLVKRFKLFPVHVTDPSLTMASNQVTLTAQTLAIAEDASFFTGHPPRVEEVNEHRRGSAVQLFPGDEGKLGGGLLGIAEARSSRFPRGSERSMGSISTRLSSRALDSSPSISRDLPTR
jgi:hypothetical protein